MIIKILYFDRNDDFTPNYDKSHLKEIEAENAASCMALYRALSDNHDLSKYTRTQIVDVID